MGGGSGSAARREGTENALALGCLPERKLSQLRLVAGVLETGFAGIARSAAVAFQVPADPGRAPAAACGRL
jgi:hypothetical protein